MYIMYECAQAKQGMFLEILELIVCFSSSVYLFLKMPEYLHNKPFLLKKHVVVCQASTCSISLCLF